MDGDVRLLTVVGVVGDTRHNSLADDPTPIVYTHLKQRAGGASTLSFVLSTSGSGVSSEVVRAAVREAAPDLSPVTRDYPAVVSNGLGDRAFLLRLVAGFALAALLLATAASAGVAAFGVARRRRELGVRLACGAAPASLLRLVLREQLDGLAISLALGVFATWVAGRALQAQLWGVRPTDPIALLGAATALAVVVLAATAVPAARAAATDPVEALRGE
jgi:ABC-type antimicrobial peptide transport system permease subunit